MKKNRFIATVAAFAVSPFVFGIQNQKSDSKSVKGFKISSGEGRIHGHLQLKGINSNIMDLKISGKDTNGDLAIFEQTSLSQGRGTPLQPTPEEIANIFASNDMQVVGPPLKIA